MRPFDFQIWQHANLKKKKIEPAPQLWICCGAIMNNLVVHKHKEEGKRENKKSKCTVQHHKYDHQLVSLKNKKHRFATGIACNHFECSCTQFPSTMLSIFSARRKQKKKGQHVNLKQDETLLSNQEDRKA